MISLRRLLSSSLPWRSLRALRGLAQGVRIHPSAVLIGSPQRILLGRATKLGTRCRLDTGSLGRIVVGERVWISADVEIQTDGEVRIGEGTTIQRRCTVNGNTRIGAQCIFAPNVFVSSGTHPFREAPHLPIREQERLIGQTPGGLAAFDRPVWIQDDCWLGVNAVVCPGVTIGKGSVVGANAVVTRDVPPYSVVAGSPARVIGKRLDWRPPAIIKADRAEDLAYVLSSHKVVTSTDYQPAIELVPGDTLVAALRAPESHEAIAMHYLAAAPIDLTVGQAAMHARTGRGVMHLPMSHLQTREGTIWCHIDIAARGVALHVRQLEIVRKAPD